MENAKRGDTVPQNETVVYVDTSTIHINAEKESIYLVDKAFESIKLSIKNFGIKEPIIAEKESNVVIAGNRRLKAARELGISSVPVIFREMGDKDRKLVYITHENQREKTYSQYLSEYRILQERYPLSQGARTDLKQVDALNAEALRVLTGLSRTTLFYLIEIDRLALAKYKNGKESKSYKNIWNELDEGYKTPKHWYDKLKPISKDERENASTELFSIEFNACKVINGSFEDVSKIIDNSISCFLSSPPNWGIKIKDGGKKGLMLGTEKNAEEYLENLVSIYKKSLPKLKKEGSIWVKMTDICIQGEYHSILTDLSKR